MRKATDCNTEQEHVARDKELKLMAARRVTEEITARLLLLLLHLTCSSTLTPDEFFHLQFNGASITLETLVGIAKMYDDETLRCMITELSKQLRDKAPKQQLIIAVDEAQLADLTLRDELLSIKCLLDKVRYIR